jgi:group I intron endonuclease
LGANAIVDYGLSHFAFVILEYCIPSDQLKREQHYLDILFSLPANLRYNFNPTAGSSLGYKHTGRRKLGPKSQRLIQVELILQKAQMSDSMSGANNPMYGRTEANHPRYGRTHSPESSDK